MPVINFTKIPLITTIKFVPSKTIPDWGFDNSWCYEQIKSWENKVCYKQKWQFGDQTPIQIWSTIAPGDVKLYNRAGVVVKAFTWTVAAVSATLGNLYEVVINLDKDNDDNDIPAGIYYVYFITALLGYSYPVISEPIDLRISHPDTNVLSVSNTFNSQGVFWHTGIVLNMRCEVDLIDFQPGREVEDYIDQLYDVEVLDGIAYREFKLCIGKAPGVPGYIVDIINRITCCDGWRFNGTLFSAVKGAKWEPTRIKGWPMSGWAIDVSPKVNMTVLEHNQDGPIAPGLVTAYDITNDLFGGTGTPVPITDYKQT